MKAKRKCQNEKEKLRGEKKNIYIYKYTYKSAVDNCRGAPQQTAVGQLKVEASVVEWSRWVLQLCGRIHFRIRGSTCHGQPLLVPAPGRIYLCDWVESGHFLSLFLLPHPALLEADGCQRFGPVSCPLTLQMMNQFRNIALYTCVYLGKRARVCVCVCGYGRMDVIADVALNIQLAGKQQAASQQIFNTLILS